MCHRRLPSEIQYTYRLGGAQFGENSSFHARELPLSATGPYGVSHGVPHETDLGDDSDATDVARARRYALGSPVKPDAE